MRSLFPIIKFLIHRLSTSIPLYILSWLMGKYKRSWNPIGGYYTSDIPILLHRRIQQVKRRRLTKIHQILHPLIQLSSKKKTNCYHNLEIEREDGRRLARFRNSGRGFEARTPRTTCSVRSTGKHKQ